MRPSNFSTSSKNTSKTSSQQGTFFWFCRLHKCNIF
jgi:hypothetical protein